MKELLAEDGLEDLLLTTEEIRRRDNAKFIFYYWYRFWQARKRERTRQAAALKLQTYLRGRHQKNTSFINALELGKYPKIYFLKEQKPQFVKILRQQMPLLQQNDLTFDDAMDFIEEDTKYETIRVEEPDLFEYKPLPLLQFIMPTFGKKTIVRENRSLGLDKKRNEDFSLDDFLFTNDTDFTGPKMSILKKRKCHFKPARLRAELEKR